jgi:hypothetical protein
MSARSHPKQVTFELLGIFITSPKDPGRCVRGGVGPPPGCSGDPRGSEKFDIVIKIYGGRVDHWLEGFSPVSRSRSGGDYKSYANVDYRKKITSAGRL